MAGALLIKYPLRVNVCTTTPVAERPYWFNACRAANSPSFYELTAFPTNRLAYGFNKYHFNMLSDTSHDLFVHAIVQQHFVGGGNWRCPGTPPGYLSISLPGTGRQASTFITT